MRRAVFIVLLLCVPGLAQSTRPASTRPSSRPTDASLADAQKQLDEAKASDQRESADTASRVAVLTSNFAQTEKGKELVARVQSLENSLTDARRNGTPQDKLDASSAYNKARSDLATAQNAYFNTDDQLKQLRGQKAVADQALKAAQQRYNAIVSARAIAEQTEDRARAEAEANGPIPTAIKEHRLEVGMTIEQAREAMHGKQGELVAKTADGREQYHWGWEVSMSGPMGYHASDDWFANFEDGKIVTFSHRQ